MTKQTDLTALVGRVLIAVLFLLSGFGKLAAPAASALRPTGPAAILTLPPSVTEADCANARTAAASFKMKTKSVSSNPICPPNPPPAVARADGADQ